MKVKVFYLNAVAEKVEEEINEFIKGKKVLFVCQTESQGEEGWGINITIWYE